jgi:hypothetical protein
MSIINRWIIFLITLSCVFTFTFPSNGYCDEWVLVGKDIKVLFYYNKTNIQIDTKSDQIKVWIKLMWTKKGLKELNPIEDEMSKTLCLYYFNYKQWKQYLNRRINYSKSGIIIDDIPYKTNWEDILPDSIGNIITNKILKDYNIQR